MGDGTQENPFTREDVLKLIEMNGRTSQGLSLEAKKFEEGIDLSGLDLTGIILNKAKLFRANFSGSVLDLARFSEADLQYATFNNVGTTPTSVKSVIFTGAHLKNAEFRLADLTAAQFRGEILKTDPTIGVFYSVLPAFLENTDFRGANLFLAGFKGCYFYGTKLEGAYIRGADIFEAHLEYVDWGNHTIGDELAKDFSTAEDYYRRLKIWYTQAGLADTTAKFYYREKEASRKALKLLSRNWRHRLALQLSYLFFGHGEGWKRVLIWITGVVASFSLIYFLLGALKENSFWEALYYSAVSFISLGYGSWFYADSVQSWARGVGVLEAFIGFGLMTLLLVTFVRKMAR